MYLSVKKEEFGTVHCKERGFQYSERGAQCSVKKGEPSTVVKRKGSSLSTVQCKERGAALSVGGKQPWAGLSWMCVGTRHLRRFNHYRHYPTIMQIPLTPFMQGP